MDFDDPTSLSLTIEALEGITDATAENDPRLGSEFEFLLSTELEGELDAAALGFILQQLEKEEGKKRETGRGNQENHGGNHFDDCSSGGNWRRSKRDRPFACG